MTITVQPGGNRTALSASRSPTTTLTGYTPKLNDVVHMFVRAGTNSATIQVPSGWVNPLGGNTVINNTGETVVCVYHLVTQAEADAVTTTYTASLLFDSAQSGGNVAVALRGIDMNNIVDDVNTSNGDTATSTHVLAGLTGVNLVNNSLVIGGLGGDGTQTYTDPGGWTLVAKNVGGQNTTGMWYSNTRTTNGTDVASTNVTASSAARYASIVVAYSDASEFPAPSLAIPNPFVGPMALRYLLRPHLSRPQDGSVAVSGALTGTATSTDITVGLTADGFVGVVGTDSSAITVGLTADGFVAISTNSTSTDLTVGLTADGSVDAGIAAPQLIIPNRYVGPMALRAAFRRTQPWIGAGFELFNVNVVSTDITVGLTADGVVGVVGSETSSITVGLTADGIVGAVSSTSTAITVGLTADGVVGTVGTASTAITVGLTADGTVGTVTGATSTDLTIGLTADGSVDAGIAPPQLIIPNRYVGPMALRAAFRRATPQAPAPDAQSYLGTTTSTDITVGLTASGVIGTVSSETSAITVGLTADGVVGTLSTTSTTVTAALTADGSVDAGIASPQLIIPNRFVGPMALRAAFRRAQPWIGAGFELFNVPVVDTVITVGLSADGIVGVVGTESASITVGLTSDGVIGTVGTASSTITVGLTADGIVGTVGSESTAITIGLTADSAVGTISNTSTAITVGLTADGSVDAGIAAPQLILPNRFVGPMALRNAFRRAQPWIGAGFELFNVNVASTDIVVGLTADGAVGTVGTASAAITVGLTADGVVGTVSSETSAITVGLTADGVVGLFGSADTAITVGLSADGSNPANVTDTAPAPFRIPNRNVGPMALRNAFRRADLWLNQLISYLSDSVTTAITVGLTATGAVGTLGDASTTITVGLTAAGTAGVVGQASTAITVGLTAAGVVGAVGSTSSAITIGLTADGVVGLFGDTSSSITVGLTAAGSVDAGIAAPPLLIPNRYVGPMALRQAFRRAQSWTGAGFELFNVSGVDTAITVGLTADGVVGVVGSDTVSITVGLTAAGVVGEFATANTAITVGLSAAGSVGVKQASVTTDVTVGLSAAGAVGVRSSGSTAITVGLTADGFITSNNLTGTANTAAVVIGLTAAGRIGTSSIESTAIMVGLSAAGIVLVATPSDRIHVIDVEDDECDVAGEARIHVIEVIAFTSSGPGEDRIYIVPAEVRTT